MSAKKGAVIAARKGFAAALTELEGTIAKKLAASPAPGRARVPAPTDGMLPGLELQGDAALAARVAELEAALVLAERERDAARAALTALRAARAEEARLVEDALRDLRQVS